MSGLNKKNQAGFRVAHDFDDFMEDREVVLTLQDSYILGGQDINPDGDVLENIDMAENYKSQLNIDNRTAKKDDYLDNKYGFGEKKILPQYDEKSTEKEGIMLDSYGEFNLDRQRKIEAIKNKLAGPKKGGEISLETSKNVASEYLTSDEMKKFKKPVKKAVVHKNKQDILKFLEDSLEDEEGNLGTRDSKKARERADLDDVTTKKLKTENYEAALEKAREQTKQSAMVDEEYDEIQRAIENQRRAAQQKKNNVEDIVRTLIGNTKTANSIDTNEVVVLDNKKKPADAEFIELDSIKASTDFLRGVATRDLMLEQKAKITEPVSLSLKDTRNGMASVVNVSLPSERLLARNKAQSGLESLKLLRKEAPTAGSNNTEKKDEAAEDIYTAEDLEQLTEERNFIAEDDFNEGGLAAALKAARERGYLMENEAEIRGRGKDKTYREELAKFDKPGKPSKNDGDERVRLEYRDKNGRLMTPKEAFRYQCRIFHGIDPSKTKQEKERKKWEASKKSLQIAPQESGSMKAFQILQKQNNQAHVVLDTKNLK